MRMKTRWLFSSMRTRILILFAVMWLVVTAVLAEVAIHTQVQTAQNAAVQNSVSRLALMNNAAESVLAGVDLVGIRLSISPQLCNLAAADYAELDAEAQRLLMLRLRMLLYEDKYAIDAGHAVKLMLRCADGRVYTNLNGMFALAESDSLRALAAQLCAAPLADKNSSICVGAGAGTLPADTLTYHRRFASIAGGACDADILIFYSHADFIKRLPTAYLDENWGVLDDGGRVLAAGTADWTGKTVQELFSIAPDALVPEKNSLGGVGGNRLLVYLRNADSCVISVHALSRSAFIRSALDIIAAVIGIALFCLSMFLLLSAYLSKRLTAPLNKLGRKMMQASGGDMTAHFDARYHDEIGVMGDRFDAMVDQLRYSMEQLRETEDEKRAAELRALEMLINPHFLYNTLSSIIWLISAGKNEDAISITKMLSNYLRQSLSAGREFISVREEIEHVRTYMNIQNYRYANEVQMFFEVEAATESLLMPKLLLQPLVENALYHGIKMRESAGGVIRLCATAAEGQLRFAVWDNGGALSPEDCGLLNARLQARENTGIGTGTVNNRIKLYFGQDYGLSFRREGEWTIADVNIPALNKEDSHESIDRG